MSVNHISIDERKPHGRQLRRGLSLLREALAVLRAEAGAMTVMVDGSDYVYLEDQFGFPAGKGQSAKGELESTLAKFNTDADVTNVKAATDQLLNFLS